MKGDVSGPDRDPSLQEARAAYAEREWDRARIAYSRADEDARASLSPADLEQLAIASYMAGHDDGYSAALERAHRAHLNAGQARPAIRCAFWLGLHHALRDEMARAGGWLGRAGRLIEAEGADCVEQGYLMLPRVIQAQGRGDWVAAAELSDRALAVGQRFGDRDLATLALHAKGLSRVKAGQVEEGLGLLDEAMVAIVADELSPRVTGIVYCSVIEGCRDAYVLRRAREWTSALARWCAGQPELVAFSGECLMYRADILCLAGDWGAALDEAEQARARFERVGNPGLAARACYQQAEVLRIRGQLEDALALYEQAGREGHEPQPGLALLRLAQGDVAAAEAAIRRVTGETRNPLERARLLPAYVEILLGAGDLEAARSASEELTVIAQAHHTDMLVAMASSARGAVRLAEGEGMEALVELRDAAKRWQALGAPYETARVRERIGAACRAAGDLDSAKLELDAARAAFERLGARLDAARLASLVEGREGGRIDEAGEQAAHGLTERELEVLRLVAVGHSNREIASELVISEHTVARHLQNIFAKIDVGSRTAAGAYAHEHGLV